VQDRLQVFAQLMQGTLKSCLHTKLSKHCPNTSPSQVTLIGRTESGMRASTGLQTHRPCCTKLVCRHWAWARECQSTCKRECMGALCTCCALCSCAYALPTPAAARL